MTRDLAPMGFGTAGTRRRLDSVPPDFKLASPESIGSAWTRRLHLVSALPGPGVA